MSVHIYTESALKALAQVGVRYGRIWAYFCTTDSSVFDATFNRPLKQTTVAAGVTTQTGLFDSGVTTLDAGQELKVEWTYLAGFPFFYQTAYAWSVNAQRGRRIGSDTQTSYTGPIAYNPFRSVLIAVETSANSALSRQEQSYPLCMIDFGGLVSIPSIGYLTINWGIIADVVQV